MNQTDAFLKTQVFQVGSKTIFDIICNVSNIITDWNVVDRNKTPNMSIRRCLTRIYIVFFYFTDNLVYYSMIT